MRARSLLLVTMLLGPVLAGRLPTLEGSAAPPRDERPNLVLLNADDVGYGDLGCYGNEIIRTPRLDRLAEEGLTLTACYAGAPSCSPSRASLLTGRASLRTRINYVVRDHTDAAKGMPLSEVTIAELLADGGYATFHGGKWHLDPKPELEGDDNPIRLQGFEESYSKTGDICGAAVRWLERRREAGDKRPFFCYLALYECHEPVDVRSPAEYRDLYRDLPPAPKRRGKGADRRDPKNRAVYYGCVSSMDAAVGRLLDGLERLELDDSTLVLFTSDNGPANLSPNAWGDAGTFRGAKGTLWEGGIRVPGLVRWPGHVPAGRVSDVPVHAFDVLPTFCELAGVALPPNRAIDGESVVPLLGGEAFTRTKPLVWIYPLARGGFQGALRSGPWKLTAKLETTRAKTDDLAYLQDAELTSFELFHVVDDPKERANVAADHAEVLARMRDELVELFDDARRELLAP